MTTRSRASLGRDAEPSVSEAPRAATPAPIRAGPLETEYRPRHPLDLRRTVLYQRRGAGDPTMAIVGRGDLARGRTPDGRRHARAPRDAPGRHPRRGLGTGPAWALAQLPALCGAATTRGLRCARHPLIADAHHRNPGLRLSAPTSCSTRSRARSSSRRSPACRRSARGGASSRGSASGRRGRRRGRCSRRRPSTDGSTSRRGSGIAPDSSRRSPDRRARGTARRRDRARPLGRRRRRGRDRVLDRARTASARGRPPRPASGRSATPTP